VTSAADFNVRFFRRIKKMASIERKDLMHMVATMCAGIFANPTSVNIINDLYGRQQVIQQMIIDIQCVAQNLGINIIETDEQI